MQAEILTIGDELCRGEILDTNSTTLASGLWEIDVVVAWMTSCRDSPADMARAIECAAERADLVIVSGGLGPTLDDLTVDIVADLLGVDSRIDTDSKLRMDQRMSARGYRPPAMDRQVRVPEGANVYQNRVGAAPAFEVRIAGTPVFCLPGPPRELGPIFWSDVRRRIVELREARGEKIVRIAKRTYRVFGKGESQVAELVDGICDDIAGASLHFQVKYPSTFVKIVIRDSRAEDAAQRLAVVDGEIRRRLGRYLYGIDDETLADAVGGSLRRRGLSLATAESCTGGLIGALITAVPGSSRYYLGGAVTYSNREKARQLGVSEQILETVGAVSEECAAAMARGARDAMQADVAVAVTGIAGPDGGSEEKPVGTVWLAVVGPGSEESTRRLNWKSSREQIRELAAHAALAMVLRAVEGSV